MLIAFGLFGMLLLEGVRIAERNPDPYASTVAFGLVALIASHLAINTAMTVGMMPITGLPLPFISKGGSFLVVCFACSGSGERSGSNVRRSDDDRRYAHTHGPRGEQEASWHAVSTR